LCAVAFTFGAKAFQPELQASLANDPCPVKAMKKSIVLSYTYAYLVFMLCACTGYAAFGNTVDGNILTSIRNAATNPAQRALATFAQVGIRSRIMFLNQIFTCGAQKPRSGPGKFAGAYPALWAIPYCFGHWVFEEPKQD
jgi:amino acid permease